MQDLPRRLKGLQGEFQHFAPEIQPSWDQAGQVFNVLLAAAKDARPNHQLFKASDLPANRNQS
jgi:hypothetical protein